jgi:cell division protein FtsL
MTITTDMLLVASFVVNAFVIYEYTRMLKIIKKIDAVNGLILYALEEISDGKIQVSFGDEEEQDDD